MWSRRARERLEELRGEHSFVRADGSTLVSRGAGTRANACLAGELGRVVQGRVEHYALTITVEGAESLAVRRRRWKRRRWRG